MLGCWIGAAQARIQIERAGIQIALRSCAVELKEFEAWGKTAVERAVAVVGAELPAATVAEKGRVRMARQGYVGRWVHFRHPGMPEDRVVWLYAVPAGHPYDFKPVHARLGAGLLQDVENELDRSRFAAGLNNAFAWSWKTHVDDRWEGWRLAVKVEPDEDDAAARGEELAAEVLRGLRQARLLS
jgi:hypothetical protein